MKGVGEETEKREDTKEIMEEVGKVKIFLVEES